MNDAAELKVGNGQMRKAGEGGEGRTEWVSSEDLDFFWGVARSDLSSRRRLFDDDVDVEVSILIYEIEENCQYDAGLISKQEIPKSPFFL